MDRKRENTVGQWVLLVENDVLLRMHLAKYLRDCGYKVAEAISVREATVLLKRSYPEIAVVISNVELAGDGFGLSQWLKDNRPELPILLTGTIRRAVAAASQLCKEGSLPTVPEAADVLLQRVQQALAKPREQAHQHEYRPSLQDSGRYPIGSE